MVFKWEIWTNAQVSEKCQSTDPVSFTSETSCLCTRKARSMASSALWGKLRVSRFSPRSSSFQMARPACLLAFTLQHFCTFFYFSPNPAHRGRLGLDVNVLRPRPVSAQKSLLYRKLCANASGMHSPGSRRANICALAPSLRFRLGVTERVYRDRGDGGSVGVNGGVFLKFGDRVLFHLHASHCSLLFLCAAPRQTAK